MLSNSISYKNLDVAIFTTKPSNYFVGQFCNNNKDDNAEEKTGISDGNSAINLGA